MEKKKHYLVYKTTNDLNGMYYIGKHATTNPNDSYLGSGVYLTRAIEKYGKEHFHREILFDFDTEAEMDAKERELVDESVVKDEMCYNLMLGGEGGDTWTGTGRRHSDETRKRLSEISKQKWECDEYRNKVLTRIREVQEYKRKYCLEELKEMYRKISEKTSKSQKGKSISQEHRKAISNGIKRYYDKVGRKHNYVQREFHCDKSSVCGKQTYVNNGTKEYRIYVEELSWFLSHGWSSGRSPMIKKASYSSQEASDSASGKGKFVVHNKELREVKRINPDELQTYLDNGWERGYLNKKKKRI